MSPKPKFPFSPLPLPLLLLRILFLCPLSVTAATAKIGQGYHLISLQETPDGGLLGLLQVKQESSIYGLDIAYLQLYVKHETDDRLRVRITDAQKQRWEVPYDLLPREPPPPLSKPPIPVGRTPRDPVKVSNYYGSVLTLSYMANPFSFKVMRRSTGETLFDTGLGPSDPYSDLVFKDQYLEVSTWLPANASLYGLGENTQPHGIKLYPDDPYTLITTDVSAINLNTDLYGAHPVYMDLRAGMVHAVLLLNSNGMDVTYRGTSLTYKMIGGVLDFYFFAGPSPLSVVDQYTQLVGRPAPMPYWSFEGMGPAKRLSRHTE